MGHPTMQENDTAKLTPTLLCLLDAEICRMLQCFFKRIIYLCRNTLKIEYGTGSSTTYY